MVHTVRWTGTRTKGGWWPTSTLIYFLLFLSTAIKALLSESIGHSNAKLFWPFNQFCFCSGWCLCLGLPDRISITVSKPGFKRTRSKPACLLLHDFYLSAEWSPILYGAISATCYSKPLSFPSRDSQCHWSLECRALNKWRHCGSLSPPGSFGSNQILNLVRNIRSSGPGKGEVGRHVNISSKRNPPTHGHITPFHATNVFRPGCLNVSRLLDFHNMICYFAGIRD